MNIIKKLGKSGVIGIGYAVTMILCSTAAYFYANGIWKGFTIIAFLSICFLIGCVMADVAKFIIKKYKL